MTTGNRVKTVPLPTRLKLSESPNFNRMILNKFKPPINVKRDNVCRENTATHMRETWRTRKERSAIFNASLPLRYASRVLRVSCVRVYYTVSISVVEIIDCSQSTSPTDLNQTTNETQTYRGGELPVF